MYHLDERGQAKNVRALRRDGARKCPLGVRNSGRVSGVERRDYNASRRLKYIGKAVGRIG